MKGALLIGHGELDQLKISNGIPKPSPREHEVLIRVAAAGINNTDINTRIAWYSKDENSEIDASWSGEPIKFPLIQGADVCGEIVEVGSAVPLNRIGERVLIEPCITEENGKKLETPSYFGSEYNGGFAEYTIVSSKHAYKIESNLSNVELASFPCSYSTAENMLTRASVVSGDLVFITGASGGVGSAAIQLAKARGAKVIALTSQSKKTQLLELGADDIVTRDENLLEVMGKNSVDVAIDLVAGSQWPQLLEIIKPRGRYAVAGAIGGPLVKLDIRTLYLKDLSFFGCTVLEPKVFSNLIKRIEAGQIKPLISKTFTLENIKKAQLEFIEKAHVGKLVITF